MTSNPVKYYFLYSCNKQSYNLGDVLISQSLVSFMKRHGCVLAWCPAAFKTFGTRVGLDEEETFETKPFFLQILLLLFRSAISLGKIKICLFITPGGIGGVYRLSNPLTQFFKLAAFMVLKTLGVRVLHVGSSIHRMSLPRAVYQKLFSMVKTRTIVRDDATYRYLNDLGFSNISRAPDLAFGLSRKILNEYKSLESTEKKYSYLLSFKDFSCDECPEYLAKTTRLLKEILSAEAEGQFCLTYQVETDRKASIRISKELACDYLAFHEETLNEQSAVYFYTDAVYVLSNRLHVLILAFMCGAIPIGVGVPYLNKKVEEFCLESFVDSIFIDVEKYDIEKVRADMQRAHEKYMGRTDVAFEVLVEKQRLDLEEAMKSALS